MLKYLLALLLLTGCAIADPANEMTRKEVLEDYCTTRGGVFSFYDVDNTHFYGTCKNGDYYIYNNGEVTNFNLRLEADDFR